MTSLFENNGIYERNGVQFIVKEVIALLKEQGNLIDVVRGGLVTSRQGEATQCYMFAPTAGGDFEVIPRIITGGMFIVNPYGTSEFFDELTAINADRGSEPEIALPGPNSNGPTYDVTPGFWSPKYLLMSPDSAQWFVSVGGSSRHLQRLNEINNETWPE